MSRSFVTSFVAVLGLTVILMAQGCAVDDDSGPRGDVADLGSRSDTSDTGEIVAGIYRQFLRAVGSHVEVIWREADEVA